jgi:DnaJ-class molecular chaperone
MSAARPTVRPAAWRNSNLGPSEARKQGKCGDCGGTGRFQQPIGGKLVAVICRDCEGSDEHRR